jgi:nicotinamidase-related amidase
MANPDRLDVIHAQLLVIDFQERMLPHVGYHDEVVAGAVKMIRAAREMELAITYTEQYPQGLGGTDPRIRAVVGDAPRFEKTTFSVCADEALRRHITSLMRPQVLIVGVETHICVQQTALDLLGMQMRPFVLADAVGSRRTSDRQVALDRMRAAGVVVTTVEATIYALLHESGTELFKRILPIVK